MLHCNINCVLLSGELVRTTLATVCTEDGGCANGPDTRSTVVAATRVVRMKVELERDDALKCFARDVNLQMPQRIFLFLS